MTVLAIATTHASADLVEADDVVSSLSEAAPQVMAWVAP
jgi:hypothetical protein